MIVEAIFIPDGKSKAMSTLSSKVDSKKLAKGADGNKWLKIKQSW